MVKGIFELQYEKIFKKYVSTARYHYLDTDERRSELDDFVDYALSKSGEKLVQATNITKQNIMSEISSRGISTATLIVYSFDELVDADIIDELIKNNTSVIIYKDIHESDLERIKLLSKTRFTEDDRDKLLLNHMVENTHKFNNHIVGRQNSKQNKTRQQNTKSKDLERRDLMVEAIGKNLTTQTKIADYLDMGQSTFNNFLDRGFRNEFKQLVAKQKEKRN